MLNSDPKKSSPLPQGRRCRGKCQARSQQCQAGGNHGARDSGEGNLCGEGTSQESLSEGHAGEPETEEARRGQAGEEGICCLKLMPRPKSSQLRSGASAPSCLKAHSEVDGTNGCQLCLGMPAPFTFPRLWNLPTRDTGLELGESKAHSFNNNEVVTNILYCTSQFLNLALLATEHNYRLFHYLTKPIKKPQGGLNFIPQQNKFPS